MAKRFIRLTEEELNSVIQEATKQVMEESSLITEMAYHRKEFINEINNKTTEIIRNYALVFYANLHGLQTIDQWSGELITYITDFQDMETKPKPGNRKMVKRAIQEVWIDKMELNTHPQAIIHKYIAKFKDEGIVATNEEHMAIVESFVNNLDMLSDEMAFVIMIQPWILSTLYNIVYNELLCVI